MTQLRTDDVLVKALERASKRTLTSQELHKQRVSYIIGLVDDDNGITREVVERVLAEQQGR